MDRRTSWSGLLWLGRTPRAALKLRSGTHSLDGVSFATLARSHLLSAPALMSVSSAASVEQAAMASVCSVQTERCPRAIAVRARLVLATVLVSVEAVSTRVYSSCFRTKQRMGVHSGRPKQVCYWLHCLVQLVYGVQRTSTAERRKYGRCT